MWPKENKNKTQKKQTEKSVCIMIQFVIDRKRRRWGGKGERWREEKQQGRKEDMTDVINMGMDGWIDG